MLNIKNHVKKFGRKMANDNISFYFDEGVYGLLGPNGSGKTTLMRSILGLYKSNKGEITYGGQNVLKDRTYIQEVGYLPQAFNMFKELKLYEMMAYFACLKEIDRKDQQAEIEKCLKYVGLNERSDSNVKSLSGGMIRRAGIAQALLGDPRLIIVDEPTAGLDPEERTRFKNVLVKLRAHKTIIISTHIVEDVEMVCDNIIIMKDGKIIKSGSKESIVEMTKGMVCTVPASQETSLQGNYQIVKRSLVDGSEVLRVVSDTWQEGSYVEPSLEDSYIALMNGIV